MESVEWETPAHPLDETFQHYGLPAAASGQSLDLFTTPDAAYSALMELINSAGASIDAVFYIVANDKVGNAFVDALTARAAAGVKIRLLMDRYGTLRSPHKALKRLKKAGGEVRFFSPLLQLPGSGRLNLRNHRKMVIADNARVFAGGMNIADHYLSIAPSEASWADLSFVLQGMSARVFSDVFRSDWEVASGTSLPMTEVGVPGPPGDAVVQLVPSGPDIVEDPLHDGLVRAVHMAEKRIWIATPYFIPTEPLGNALRIAAHRGVDLRILVPAKSNQKLADFARGAYLREMHAAGAKLLYYTSGMMHGKAALIDGLAVVGSANFDVRSMLLNFEVMLFVYDPASVDSLASWFEECSQEAEVAHPHAGLPRRLAEGVFRLGAPIL